MGPPGSLPEDVLERAHVLDPLYRVSVVEDAGRREVLLGFAEGETVEIRLDPNESRGRSFLFQGLSFRGKFRCF